MNDNEARLYEALGKIAEAANAALGCIKDHDHSEAGGAMCCTPKSLPARLHAKAASVACHMNPVNAPFLMPFGQIGAAAQVLEPQRIAVLTSKYWGARARRLTVSFMEPTPANLRAKIISHLNAWTRTGGISFVETAGIGKIRISTGSGGYYSYLGTDVLLIPRNRQTMNLEGFTMNTPDSEFRRVVRHEAGHTLGCPHEHMRQSLVARIDRQKAYDYFLRTQGWDPATVDAQVLTSLDERALMATPADQTSIMCYQLPGSITIDGRPITGGSDINASDYAFIGKIYPKVAAGLAMPESAAMPSDDWDESEDVDADLDDD